MKIILCNSKGAVHKAAANIVENAIYENPRLILGLAAGRTNGNIFGELIKAHHAKPELSFRNAVAFNTDEYVGFSADESTSTRYFLNNNFYRLVDIKMENTFSPLGTSKELRAVCVSYDSLIKSYGGIDLALLGLGHNGHVGFNEPGSSVKSRTRVVDFTEGTLAALSDGYRFKNLTQTPTASISTGLATMLEAKNLIIATTGIGKADAVHRIVDNKATAAIPASQLTTNHKKLTLIIDKTAASKIQTPLDQLNIEGI